MSHRTDWKEIGTRLKEHKTEVEFITSKPFTRNQRASRLSEQNKSALTEHASHDNHVINWPAATILDRESEKKKQMDQWDSTYSKRGTAILEPGRGELHAEPHVRPISCHVASLSWQEPEEDLTNFFWWTSLMQTETSNGKNVGCVEVIVFKNNIVVCEVVTFHITTNKFDYRQCRKLTRHFWSQKAT